MNLIAQVLLPLILMFMMFTMGLSITVGDLKKVVQFPKAFALGCILQVITLPFMAFCVAYIWVNTFNLNPLFAVGLMIIAACPGGVTSNMFTYLAKADLALSISLTSIISLLSVFTTPFIVQQSISYFIGDMQVVDFNITSMVLGIFFISSVPVIVGMIVNAKKPETAQRLEAKLKKVSGVLFIIVTIAAIAKEWKIVFSSFDDVGSITLILNLACMLLAIFVAKAFGLTKFQGRAIAYECGLQNGTMGVFIALTILKNDIIVIPSAIYSIIMFITGGIYLYLIMKRSS